MKKLFLFLVFAALIPALLTVPAAAAEYFTITDYQINVSISENGIYDVTEAITVRFAEPRHGIYRTIPSRGTWLRDAAQGGNTDWRARISGIYVDGFQYDVSRSDGNTVIKIGDPDRYVDGTQVYRISYRMEFSEDGLPEADEVYFNLIGANWDTAIDHVSFSVTLPKAFDPESLGFSTGSYGSWGYSPESLTFRVSGTTITGEVLQQLGSFEGVTMRLQLPQGYFTVPFRGAPDAALIAGSAVLVLLALILFALYGRDQKPVKTVEFYAPDGMTPSEVGYIIDGVVDTRDVVSLIIYWASRGYMTIEDVPGSSAFTFHKLRDLGDDAKPFEKLMFGSLFAGGTSVTSAALRNRFYRTVDSTKAAVLKSFQDNARRVFTKTSVALRPLISLMAALPVMVTLFLTSDRAMLDTTQAVFVTILLGVFIMAPLSVIVSTLRKWRARGRVSRVVTLVVGLILFFAAMLVFLLLTARSAYLAALPWCAVAATILLGLITSFIVKRTPKGTEWMGRICGFRDFLELAERDKLVALVEQDPKYFYNILPYAWVLGVSDKWAKKFETIAIQPPDWYYGRGGVFHPVVFMSHLNHSMSTVQSTMVSSPSSSGSGSSGGGFSGGGGGGGGGGSW